MFFYCVVSLWGIVFLFTTGPDVNLIGPSDGIGGTFHLCVKYHKDMLMVSYIKP